MRRDQGEEGACCRQGERTYSPAPQQASRAAGRTWPKTELRLVRHETHRTNHDAEAMLNLTKRVALLAHASDKDTSDTRRPHSHRYAPRDLARSCSQRRNAAPTRRRARRDRTLTSWGSSRSIPVHPRWASEARMSLNPRLKRLTVRRKRLRRGRDASLVIDLAPSWVALTSSRPTAAEGVRTRREKRSHEKRRT